LSKLNHLTICVRDFRISRDWYVRNLGVAVEFEVPDRRTAALQDESGFTFFVSEPDGDRRIEPSCILYFQVADVDTKYAELSAAGLSFTHAPAKTYWGYGAELEDPDGYPVRFWDERSMREKGSP